MKTIIALRGPANAGKSSTIGQLKSLLLLSGYQPIDTHINEMVEESIALFSKNEKIIGVTNSADSYDILHKCLEELVYSNCDICVCTCRTFDRAKQGTNAAIFEFPSYSNQFVKKTINFKTPAQAVINAADALKLLSIINKTTLQLPGVHAPILSTQGPSSCLAR